MRASHFFIGRSFNARSVEAYDRQVEVTNPSVAHDHAYEPVTDGVMCKACGFRVSGAHGYITKLRESGHL
jgi:hypothetical protein